MLQILLPSNWVCMTGIRVYYCKAWFISRHDSWDDDGISHIVHWYDVSNIMWFGKNIVKHSTAPSNTQPSGCWKRISPSVHGLSYGCCNDRWSQKDYRKVGWLRFLESPLCHWLGKCVSVRPGPQYLSKFSVLFLWCHCSNPSNNLLWIFGNVVNLFFDKALFLAVNIASGNMREDAEILALRR